MVSRFNTCELIYGFQGLVIFMYPSLDMHWVQALQEELRSQWRELFSYLVQRVFKFIYDQKGEKSLSMNPNYFMFLYIEGLNEMKPRWKGKGFEAKASVDPMSKVVSQLHSCLIETETCGLLSSCSVLVAVDAELADLLNRACFGRSRITAQKNEQWFQLDMEEAFYLCFSRKCFKVIGEDGSLKSNEELWESFKSKKPMFPISYKAYSHLRHKNWVVRLGLQYGVDFVAYRHHPALVHSEYAVLALPEGDNDLNNRLRVWSDVHCSVRLCGSVAKTLLIVIVNSNGLGADSPSCLEHYIVEERTITRWNPEQSREGQGGFQNQTKEGMV